MICQCAAENVKLFFLNLFFLSVLSLVAIPAQAEWYVAGQAGHSFADSLRNVTTTGPFSGIELQDFDMKNSPAYGEGRRVSVSWFARIRVGCLPQHAAREESRR